MKAPINTTAAAIAGGFAFALALIVVGVASLAEAACPCSPQPPCCAPPTPPPPQSFPCCAPPGNTVNIPGVTVLVQPSVVVNANAQAQVFAGAGAQGAVFVGGGGYGGYMAPGAVGLIQNLSVDGGLRRAAYEASRTKIIKVIIQAVCLDDKDVPHPASQVSPDRDIAEIYEGELYRCIAGTHLMATIAEYHGDIAFDHGWTMACDKNQALYRGHDGKVECRAQIPARDCNERSLLRRFGAGVKIVTMIITEKYTAYREETVQGSTISTAMSIDGGVGGVMY